MRKINWGVLGTAGIGEGCTFPGMMQAQNCHMYAIAGRNEEKVKAFQDRFGFEKTYNTYEAVLQDPNVEAVYIPLPNTLHYEWVLKALHAKKHVLCEKPLAPTSKQVQELFYAAKENGVYLMEAFAYLHSPYITAVKQEIEQGTIGEVRYLESAFITSDYDLSNIRMRKETLGGCTYDLGVYNTSLVLRLLGEEPEDIQAVSTFSKEGIDTFTNVLMEYKDGKKVSFSCGMVLETNQDKRIDRLEIQGTKGSIKSLDFEFNKEGELSYLLTTEDGETTVKKVSVLHNYRLEVEQFGRCIAENENPVVTEAFSIANAKMIDQILEKINYVS